MISLKFYELVIIVLSLATLITSNTIKSKYKHKVTECPKPYSHCNAGKDGFINVHIVPHTHDDVGWLKTVDQYYYGANNGEQLASVQYILDTVVTELANDPAKRFVYVEMAFFYRWWNQQNDNIKQLVRTLINEGRLEFVIGAWCMNDEATPYYTDMIDQQTLGFKFILKEFGECARPRSAWQIDPFGHSREQASLFAQFGFDGLFHGRIDYQDFDFRGETKTREFLWQASENLGKPAQLFTGILPNGYNPPPGFCFDIYCNDDPIMDDPTLEDYNVDKKVNDFIQYTMNQYSQYKTNSLIMTMGSDFQYSNAHLWFKNLDKLIHYVNLKQVTNNSKINIFYSTPACYLYALNQENQTWTVKYDDFFPYAHRPHSFWTGYFTSRAALKYYVRRASNYLQSFRKLGSFNKGTNPFDSLERAIGVVQHHDGVSGTERQHVAYDYAKRLAIGVDTALSNLFNFTLTKYNIDSKFSLCSFNISECSSIEQYSQFAAYVHNPLAYPVRTWLRVPVIYDDFTAYDVIGENELESESIPIDNETKLIPERNSKAVYNLVFQIDLMPLTLNLISFSRSSAKVLAIKPTTELKSFTVRNKFIQFTFDEQGNLNQMDNIESGLTTPFKQLFCFYKSMPGNNSESEFQASGAYIFRPQTDDCISLNVQKYTVYRGKQFDEVHQLFNEYISQTIRLYDDSRNAEFEWQVGPIDISDKIGKEIVIKFQSDLDSKSTFYTDSNGREMLKRVRDYRPTWTLNQTEKTAGNYYPINSRIYIRDEQANKQLTVVTDRSQGGASIQDGSIEIMLHRRILNDDSLGVSEPLNEPGSDNKGLIVKGKLYVLLDTIENSAKLHRQLALQLNNEPVSLFIGINGLKNEQKMISLYKEMTIWLSIPT